MERFGPALKRYLIASGWVYFTILFAWLAIWLSTGDQFGWMGIFNALGLYFFLPIPVFIVVAIAVKNKTLGVSAGLGAIAFFLVWGNLFSPHFRQLEESLPRLTVMTYNVLGTHDEIQPILDVIQRENPDILFLQEVNPAFASAAASTLGDAYPYQFLDPRPGVTGMGVLSRVPITFQEQRLPLEWVGVPQVFTMEWEGTPVTLLNFHMWAVGLGPAWAVEQNHRDREAQAQALVDFARVHKGPLILAGDANTTPLNDAYQIIAAELNDSWAAAGFGFGHTFPGSDIPGSSRPQFGNWAVPQWLVRLDYVFTSEHWQVAAVRLADFDGVSDHRGVVVELVFDGAGE